jgi:cobalt/nickel transport system permease protein
MHIPENYLSPVTAAVMTGVMVPVWGIAIKKVRTDLTAEKVTKIGIGAAFSFVGMMFNIPIPGGTTGHAVGGTLISVLLGPYAACLAVTVALLLQAVLFGDGGILALGANCFNMAFVMPFVGYAVTLLMSKILGKGKSGKDRKLSSEIISIAIGSYAGINAAALMAAIEFGIQPMLFKDSAGQALYCPYGLSVSIPAMMAAHLTVAGLAEVIFTVLIYSFIRKTTMDMPMAYMEKDGQLSVSEDGKKKFDKSVILLALLIILTPLGLLAEGTAWGEWGVEEIAETGAGFTPKGMLEGFNFEALMPDYSMSGVPDIMAYILSAVIGVALLIIFFKLASLTHKKAV